MIVVSMFTCDRPEERKGYAFQTLEGLRKLRASEELWLHVADDGSSQVYRDTLVDLGHKIFDERVSVSNSDGRGYGASWNASTQITHGLTDLVTSVEDDWQLQREFDLDPIADVVRAGVFGCVRMGYIGYTQELRGKFVSHGGLQWLALDPDSPEPHVFAGGPRLCSVEWERFVGPWPEGMAAGETEFAVAHFPNARRGVAWPVDLIYPRGDLFAHVGTLKAETPVQEVVDATA